MWKRLSLRDLTPTCMTLELADRLISRPVGVAEDVYVKVCLFYFSADFVVVDFDADPRVTLILGRSFLKIGRDLNDVFEVELALREVLGFFDVISSENPTPYYDLIVSTTSSTLTPFENSDFLFEEVDDFLAIDDDPTSLEVDHNYLDPEGDILLLEAFLNDDPSPPPNQGNYLPEVLKELKICEAKSDKSSIDEPPEVELKDLPPRLEYAFLEDMVKALLLDKKSQNQSLAPVKAVEESCVTCGDAHSYRNCPATDGNVYCENIQELISQASACMQTRSSSRLVSNPSSNPTPSINPNPKGRNRRRSKKIIEEFNLDDLSPPIVTMSDQRTVAQLLQAPTEGYEDSIVLPAITADNFELKHGLLTLVQNK
uniref:Reverse transcriptase domain-containing protein n=1 Tax=Tanacetum cinerariifolium TaxID=118510 RepID=A0A6L2N082_TANCI|nr:hypothetical protein [Tanacetum cinerariifolium]